MPNFNGSEESLERLYQFIRNQSLKDAYKIIRKNNFVDKILSLINDEDENY